ncbi:MAG: helix-turn-helix domain-containing protein [Variibacter sp.]|nr:helix-turn-helix domain-containing protein [Variibacter sp.]
MSRLGKRLLGAAGEAREIARGEANPANFRLHVPEDIDVQAIRKKLGLSQEKFAAKFGIPKGTLRDWEQRRRRPDGPARVLLLVLADNPQAVVRALERAA